jgi:hypothetical protein
MNGWNARVAGLGWLSSVAASNLDEEMLQYKSMLCTIGVGCAATQNLVWVTECPSWMALKVSPCEYLRIIKTRVFALILLEILPRILQCQYLAPFPGTRSLL